MYCRPVDLSVTLPVYVVSFRKPCVALSSRLPYSSYSYPATGPPPCSVTSPGSSMSCGAMIDVTLPRMS